MTAAATFSARVAEAFRGTWSAATDPIHDPDVAMDFVSSLEPRYGPTILRVAADGDTFWRVVGDWLCGDPMTGQNVRIPPPRWVFGPLGGWDWASQQTVDAWESAPDPRLIFAGDFLAELDEVSLMDGMFACADEAAAQQGMTSERSVVLMAEARRPGGPDPREAMRLGAASSNRLIGARLFGKARSVMASLTALEIAESAREGRPWRGSVTRCLNHCVASLPDDLTWRERMARLGGAAAQGAGTLSAVRCAVRLGEGQPP